MWLGSPVRGLETPMIYSLALACQVGLPVETAPEEGVEGSLSQSVI